MAPRAPLTLLLALPLLGAAPSGGSALSRGQRACVEGLGAALVGVDVQASRQVGACLKRYAKGKPFDRRDPSLDTLEACVAADPGGAIARAMQRTEAQFEELCSPPPAGRLEDPFPSFGATDAARVNGAGRGLGPALAHDLFGPDLDAALSTERAASRCQQAAWKAAVRCQQARTAAFRLCQQDALRGDPSAAGSRDELRGECLGAGGGGQPDPRGKVAAKCAEPEAGIAKALARACGAQDLDALLPGCAGEPAAAACLDRQVACRTCLELSDAGDLRRSCDLFDDGAANGSCGGSASIQCQSPADGAMVVAAPGTPIEFAGSVSDAPELADVTVDGVPVELDQEGFFSTPVTAGFGVHFVEVAVLDALGGERRRTCSLLAAESFGGEGDFLDGGLALRLAQGAVDDGNRGGAVNSLADVLGAVLNSSGLPSQVHAALLAANPLKASSCDYRVCAPIVGCTCVVSSEIRYVSSSFAGPRTASLALVAGGLRSIARVEDPSLTLRVRGTAGISFDVTGTVAADYIEVDQVSDVGVAGGAIRVTLRSGSLDSRMGAITVAVSGVPQVVTDVVVALAQGSIRDILQNVVTNYVQAQFNGTLDDLLGRIELPTPGFDVPRIGAPGSIPLALEVVPSSASVSSARALFGLGARVTAPAEHDLPSLGVALPSGPVLGDPTTVSPRTLGYAGHVGVLNQSLHALWRGGLLHGHVDASVAPELPPGVEADLEALLPPVVSAGDAGRAVVQLGALRVSLAYPGFFDAPVLLSAGAEASATVAVAGNALVLQDVVLDAVHVSGVDAPLEPSNQALAEVVASVLLQRLLEAALGAALPALPVPAFGIPASLEPYGLPAGGQLGLVNAAPEITPSHLYLRGTFGVR